MPDERTPWLGKEPGRPNWYIYWYESDTGRVRRRSAGTADRRVADEALGLFLIERARAEKPATLQAPERYPVATAMRWYLQERAPDIASGPQAGWASKHLLPFFASKMVSELTPQAIIAYASHRKASRGTIRREVAVLSAAVNHAVKNGRLTSAPKIILPPAGKARDKHLDEDEIAVLLDACRDTPHVYLFAMIALNTGARKGAILDLSWLQVRFAEGLIYFNPEDREQTTKRRAIVPISAALREALEGAHERRMKRAEKKKTAPCPFVIEYRGCRILDIKKGFAAAANRAADAIEMRAAEARNEMEREHLLASAMKLRATTPHVLRHTAGTIMAKGGIDLFIIARMLGHSVAKTTELYAHHRPEWLAGAADVLSKATKREQAALTKTLTENKKGLADVS